MPIEHIHPMLVHFPIVLALTALLFDVLRVAREPRSDQNARVLDTGTSLLALAAIFAILSFLFGDMAFDIAVSHGFTEAKLEDHESWGSMTTIAFVLIGMARVIMWGQRWNLTRRGRFIALGLSALASIMVVYTAYLGGHLVYDLGVNVATGAG